jgi:glycosyltransferase involved in cell wall biosynthesis
MDHSNSMYLRTVRPRPSLITCHDVLAVRAARCEFPQQTTGWTGKLLQRWILSGLRNASHVVCVSAKTASDLGKLTGLSAGQIRVIQNPLHSSFRPGAAHPHELFPGMGLSKSDTYFLHVGGNQWYKNRLGVLRIYAQLILMPEFATARLVMAGKSWTDAMRDFVHNGRLAGRVIEAVDVSNRQLQSLYCNALALLFPSLEEGFGWPIVEAQACGCPVITSGRPPMLEVAGDAAIFIDPGEPATAAEAIADGLAHRDRLCAAGFRNLDRFDEKSTVDQYLACYESILAAGPVSAR